MKLYKRKTGAGTRYTVVWPELYVEFVSYGGDGELLSTGSIVKLVLKPHGPYGLGRQRALLNPTLYPLFRDDYITPAIQKVNASRCESARQKLRHGGALGWRHREAMEELLEKWNDARS